MIADPIADAPSGNCGIVRLTERGLRFGKRVRNRMTRRTRLKRWPQLLLVGVVLALAGAEGLRTDPAQGAAGLVGKPLKAGSIYTLGERAGWTFPPVAEGKPGQFRYELKEDNFVVVRSGSLDLSQKSEAIEFVGTKPGIMWLELKDPNNKIHHFAAAIAPDQIKPAAPRPPDFDAFWTRKLKELRAIPMNAKVSPKENPEAGIEHGLVQLDHISNTKVHGHYVKPEGDGKYPAVLMLQWASPPYPLDKSWILGFAKSGWLALNTQPHDVLASEPASYYQSLPDRLKNYAAIEQENLEKNYFVEMYLRGVRAVDFLVNHPNWDGKTLLIVGTSMGGMQCFAVAGLHDKVTHMMINVPAGCDLNGPLHGHSNSYPFYPPTNAKAMEVARYIDAVNFAPRIKATSLIGNGFVDTACAPTGIYAAFNQIAGKKEMVAMFDSPHNHLATPEQQRPYVERSNAWVAALSKGEPAPVGKAN